MSVEEIVDFHEIRIPAACIQALYAWSTRFDGRKFPVLVAPHGQGRTRLIASDRHNLLVALENGGPGPSLLSKLETAATAIAELDDQPEVLLGLLEGTVDLPYMSPHHVWRFKIAEGYSDSWAVSMHTRPVFERGAAGDGVVEATGDLPEVV